MPEAPDLRYMRAADRDPVMRALAHADRSAAILLVSQENAARILVEAQRKAASALAQAQQQALEALPDRLATPLQDAGVESAIDLRAVEQAAAEHLRRAQEEAAAVLLEGGRQALGIRESARPTEAIGAAGREPTGEEGTSLPAYEPDSPHASGKRPELGAAYRRLRLLFDHMLEGYAYCRMLYDADGDPDDFVYVDVNGAFDTLTGLSDVVGKHVTEVIPGIKDTNPELFETYGRVARTGQPEQFEVEVEQLGIVLKISVFQPEPDYFVAVFDNITDRKRAEHELEELNRFLELRVEQRTSDLAEALGLHRPGQPGSGDTPP
jgi:PAS domain-containing protein